MRRGRAGDAEVHFRRAGIAHHLDDLHRSRTAHDGVVDEDDPLSLDQAAIGIVLALDAGMTRAVGRLDEGATDIVRADDAELERNAGTLGIADGRGDAAVGHRNDEIDVDRIFDRKLCTDGLACRIHRAPVENRIGAAEVDMLENAGARRTFAERPMAVNLTVEIDADKLARLDFAHQMRANDVERHAFAGEHHRFAHLPHDERTNAQRIAACDHSLGRHHDQRIRPFDEP